MQKLLRRCFLKQSFLQTAALFGRPVSLALRSPNILKITVQDNFTQKIMLNQREGMHFHARRLAIISTSLHLDSQTTLFPIFNCA